IATRSRDCARSLNEVKASAGERVGTSSPSSQVLTMPTSLSYSSMVSLADLSSRSSSTLPRGMHVTNNSGGDMQTVPAECLGATHGTFDSIPLFAKAPQGSGVDEEQRQICRNNNPTHL